MVSWNSRNVLLGARVKSMLRGSHGKVSHAVAVQYFFTLLAQAYFWHLGKMAERENGPLSLSMGLA